MPIQARCRPPKLAGVFIAFCWLVVCACGRQTSGAPSPRAKLLTGMGAIHHPIATGNPGAQKFFDQGLALVYAFNFGEAINSFRHASELDQNAPMPYWGLALAYAPNYNAWNVGRGSEQAGFDAIQTAVGLAPKAPEAERDYIDALARCFTDQPKPDQHQLARDYADAMRDVYHRYPDDPDAAALYAASLMNLNPWKLWSLDGAPGADTQEIVTVLEQALRRWLEHTGINHFYIHLMEGSQHPETALASAHRLETLAPSAGHLVHMPAHIYFRSGDYAAAVRSNQQALAADENYRRQQPVAPPGFMGYSSHNQYFLAVAAGMDGEFDEALHAAKEIESPMHSQSMAAMTTLVLLRFARWDQILALSPPDAKFKGVTFVRRFARACARAAKGQLKEAAAEQSAMEQTFASLPPGRAFGSFFNDWSTLHALAADTIAARIAAARGDATGAIASWRHAVTIQDGMNFDDVPDWYYPVRESLGASLLINKQAADAEQVFRDDLQRNPRNPRSLFGLYRALEAQQRPYQSDLVKQSFAAAWKGKQQPRIEDF